MFDVLQNYKPKESNVKPQTKGSVKKKVVKKKQSLYQEIKSMRYIKVLIL